MIFRQLFSNLKMKNIVLSTVSIWLGVYPLLTVLAFALDPLLSGQEVYIRTLIMSLLMVPLMVLFIMPFINYLTSQFSKDEKN